MAKVMGPFLSIDARGTVASTLTASNWKGVQYIKQRFVPNNPKTAKQTNVRKVLSNGVSNWRFRTDLISAPTKLLWETYAMDHGMSGFNRYMKFYMEDNYDNATGTVHTPEIIPAAK